jgi:hypothetical protein
MMILTEYLKVRSNAFLVTLGLLLLGLVAAVDYIASTRYVLEFSPFCVVPVAFFTWFIGKHAAVGLVWFGLYLAAILVLSEAEFPGRSSEHTSPKGLLEA